MPQELLRLLSLTFLALVFTTCGDPPAETDSSGAEPPPPLPRPRHILIVSVDTLRADHLGCYGYEKDTSPRIDRFASEGALFENANAPKGQTWPSLTSMITGLPPLSHGVRSNHVFLSREVMTIADAAKQASYGTGAFLANFANALLRIPHNPFERVVRADMPRSDPQSTWDARAVERALEWLEERASQPTLTWVHLMDPHRPYDIVPAHAERLPTYEGWLAEFVTVERIREGIRTGEIACGAEAFEEFLGWTYWQGIGNRRPTYGELAGRQGDGFTFDQVLDLLTLLEISLRPEDLSYVKGRYDSQIRGIDEKFGALLDRLDALGLAEETLVVFTADHGDELFDHGHYPFHSASIYEGVVRVPLIARWPGVIERGTRIERLVELMDVMPTLLQVLDRPVPPEVEGESLLPLLGHEGLYEKELAFGENLPETPRPDLPKPPLDAIYTVRDANWKFVFNASGLRPRTAPYVTVPGKSFPIATQELYHLASDPGERRDLLALDGTGASFPSDANPGSALEHARFLTEAARARERLFEALQKWFEAHRDREKDIGEPVSEDVARTLEAMGYVSGAAEITPTRDGAPSRQVLLHEEILSVVARTEGAEDEVRAEALLLAAEANLLLARIPRARELAREAIERCPADRRAALEARRARLGL